MSRERERDQIKTLTRKSSHLRKNGAVDHKKETDSQLTIIDAM